MPVLIIAYPRYDLWWGIGTSGYTKFSSTNVYLKNLTQEIRLFLGTKSWQLSTRDY